MTPDQIKRHTRESKKYAYTLLLVPRKSTLASQILEEEGVLGDVTISPYNLQFIPLAEDVISLENEAAFKEIWVVCMHQLSISGSDIPHLQDGDETVIFDAAQALVTFQKIYGPFPRIVGKGDHAAVSCGLHSDLEEDPAHLFQRLANLLTRSLPQSSTNNPDTLLMPSQKLDCLIILDRRVDMITPLLTQLTYEGLIDELLGIKNCEWPDFVPWITVEMTSSTCGTSFVSSLAPGTTHCLRIRIVAAILIKHPCGICEKGE
jgi:vacuolar protein sorting-associated protein 33A